MIRLHSLPIIMGLLTFFSATAMAQTWDTIPANDIRIHYVGRTWDGKNASGTPVKLLSWSGTTASLSFEGTAVKALLTTSASVDSSWYKVFIDGVFTKDVAYLDYNTATEMLLAENLTNGTHTVTLYKRTEAMMGTQQFAGFSVLGSSTTQLKIPTRRLEFIGNSISCGYGVLDSCIVNPSTWAVEGTCPGFTTTSEDHYFAYPAVAARTLGAEDQTVCWSGKGVFRNLYGSAESPTMPMEWEFAQPLSAFSDTATAANWDYSQYVPNAVVINLGTNDFTWPANPTQAEFVGAYVNFIHRIQAEYGATIPIVLLHGPMVGDSYPAGLNVASTLSKYLDSTIAQTGSTVSKLILTPNQSLKWGIGADWHPNKSQNVLNGSELAAKLKTVLGWTGQADSSTAITPTRFVSRTFKYLDPQHIEIMLSKPGNVSVKLYNMDGQVKSEFHVSQGQGHHVLALPNPSLAIGSYILEVSLLGKTFSQNVVIGTR